MSFVFLASDRHTGMSMTASLLLGVAVAQALPQQPDKNLRLSSPSAHQQDEGQANAGKARADSDRRFREMDRKLSRTMRSVCVGC